MSRLKKIRSHKKKILLLISISLVIIGFMPQLVITVIRDLNNPYTVEPLALESEDGTYISSFLYTPVGEKGHGGIVISHRYWGDKTIMEPLSIELVRRGFTVISIDLRAHGASGGQFIRSELIMDMKAAVDYFESELPYITQIGLVGHSLGATVSAELARTYPNKINATVAIGSFSFNPVGISNLLISVGRYDMVKIEEKILDTLREYTGEQNVTIGKLYYGDFISGNNTMAFIGDYFGHMLEIIDPTIMYQTIQWFEQVFNGVPAQDIVLTEWFLEFYSYISQLGIIILNFVLIVYLSSHMFKNRKSNKEGVIIDYSIKGDKSLITFFSLLIMGFAIMFFFIIENISSEAFQLNTASLVLYINIGAAIGGFLLYPFIIMSSEGYLSFKIYYSKVKTKTSTQSKRSWVFGITSALIFISSILMFWHLPYQNFLVDGENYGILTGLILISFPVFFIKEFYFRIIQDNLKNPKTYRAYVKMVLLGIFMDNWIIFLIFSFSWINIVYIPPNNLRFSGWIMFSVIQHITAAWVYKYSKENIIGSAIYTSIIYAWLSVIIFPAYGFL